MSRKALRQAKEAIEEAEKLTRRRAHTEQEAEMALAEESRRARSEREKILRREAEQEDLLRSLEREEREERRERIRREADLLFREAEQEELPRREEERLGNAEKRMRLRHEDERLGREEQRLRVRREEERLGSEEQRLGLVRGEEQKELRRQEELRRIKEQEELRGVLLRIEEAGRQESKLMERRRAEREAQIILDENRARTEVRRRWHSEPEPQYWDREREKLVDLLLQQDPQKRRTRKELDRLDKESARSPKERERRPHVPSQPVEQDAHSSRLGSFVESIIHPSRVRRPSSVRSPPSAPPLSPLERKPTFNIQDYLPQAAEERDITEKVYAIQIHLENHVNYFYHFDMVPTMFRGGRPGQDEPLSRPDELSRQSKGAPVGSSYTERSNAAQPVVPIPSPVDERRYRAKVHHLIAHRLIKGIQPTKSAERAIFLPGEFTGLLSTLPLPESMEDDQAFTSALSQWRVLSLYLFKYKTVRKANEEEFERKLGEKIGEMLQSLDEDLKPFVDESHDEERRQHLRSLMEMTSELGVLIASQATVYRFSWDYESEDDRYSRRELSDQRDSLSSRESHHTAATKKGSRGGRGADVLFPALLKTTDRNGSRLTKPVCLCEPQMEQPRTELAEE